MGPERDVALGHVVRTTDYKLRMRTFLHSDDRDRRGVIESAEVPGPVFSEKADFAAIERAARSDAFLRLLDLSDELARKARPA
jgi:hypothetical protein